MTTTSEIATTDFDVQVDYDGDVDLQGLRATPDLVVFHPDTQPPTVTIHSVTADGQEMLTTFDAKGLWIGLASMWSDFEDDWAADLIGR